MVLNAEIGRAAEEKAAEYLMANGFKLLHRNWRYGRYELDLVAEKGDTLHIVEVKCRRAGGLTSPEDAVTGAKFQALAKAAEKYVAEYGVDLEVQFDLISVLHSAGGFELRYVPCAMVPRW